MADETDATRAADERPGWERTLRALDEAFAEADHERPSVELVWHTTIVDDAGVVVVPFVHRIGKKGRGAGKRLARRRLLAEHGASLSSADARAVMLSPDSDAFASRALLEALVGHPHVVLADDPARAVRIERTAVGLVAEDRNGTVRVSAGIDGTPLPKRIASRVVRARPEDVLFLWDGQRLTLLDVKNEARAALRVLEREASLFPPDSHGALVQALSKWAARLPVAMPRTVMGEAVVASASPLVRMAAELRGAVRVELRVRPLPESGSFTPGVGPRDVHVRRADKPLHAVRDLRAEADAAQALAQALSLSDAEIEDEPFQFHCATPEEALRLLAVLRQQDPQPELEWVGPPIRSLGSRSVSALKVVVDRRREWFGLLGGLSVEGEKIELARLLDAARRNERYVEVQPRTYVEMDETLRRHLERLADHAHLARHGIEAGLSAGQVLYELERAGATVEGDADWGTLTARIAAAEQLVPPVPPALGAELRSYQMDGFRWLARLSTWCTGAVLADDMGLGKTVQALALLLDRSERGPALVVAPTSVAFNWKHEAARFAPSLRLFLYGDVADRDRSLAELGPRDVLVVSYGLLVRDRNRLASATFATIVFDEAQNLKNAVTERFRAARALGGEFRVALSGTPIENHLGELWSLFTVVFPGLLGSWQMFRERYAAPIEKRLDPSAAPALARILQPFFLRRTKREVEPQLPPRTEVTVPVVLSTAEWALYEDARLAALSDFTTRKAKLRDQERRIHVLAALTRLRLLASHPRLYDERSDVSSSKLERLLDLVEELDAEGERALVFSQFTSHLALVREALDARGIEYVYLDGQTPNASRGERVREFQEGAAPLFLLSLKAGGEGINLTAATNVIHLDPWWNPAVEDQASDRAHRLGQTRPVTIYRLVAVGTIEEKIIELHRHKREIVAQVLEEGAEGARLSTEELVALLSPAPST